MNTLNYILDIIILIEACIALVLLASIKTKVENLKSIINIKKGDNHVA